MQLILGYEQNTPEWEAWRQSTFGASDCAAMLGISPYKTREQLIKEKFIGAPPVSAYQQALFDKGHAAEKATMLWLEERLGQAISPVVMQIKNGISASLDGLTLDGKILIEHIHTMAYHQRWQNQ